MISEIEILDCFLNFIVNLGRSDSFDQSIKLDCLFNAEVGEYRIILGAVADQLTGFLELFLHVIALNCNLSCCGCNLSGETFEGR